MIYFEAKVKIFPMEAAWFYVDVPRQLVPNIPRKGWGSVPIVAKVGKTSWPTSIFPMKKDYYFIPLKKSIRLKESILEGDKIKISFKIRTT